MPPINRFERQTYYMLFFFASQTSLMQNHVHAHVYMRVAVCVPAGRFNSGATEEKIRKFKSSILDHISISA